jgi:hypothetical protein
LSFVGGFVFSASGDEAALVQRGQRAAHQAKSSERIVVKYVLILIFDFDIFDFDFDLFICFCFCFCFVLFV